MTKEEALLKNNIDLEEMFTQYESEQIIKSMHEYAEIKSRSLSIAFLKWCVDNHSIPNEGFSLMKTHNQRTIFVNHEEITVEELYNKFIESLK